jgi:hypothetical protein
MMALMCVALGDCTRQPSNEPSMAVPLEERVMADTIRPIITEVVSGVSTRRRLVIRDADHWREFWSEVMARQQPRPDAPTVDFDRNMVIAAAMGRRQTGGYAISIEDVSRGHGRLTVTVLESSPGPDCSTIQAYTAPVVAVRVRRSDEPVTFVERRETYSCEQGR